MGYVPYVGFATYRRVIVMTNFVYIYKRVVIVCDTNFDAPSVHVPCNEKLK
jgi:hypothetical protein